eukprot:GHVN01095019.1.p1 GENE.GHVN01095019.1~~GHVN01095019.1.p1  ORF type:complete len:371 (+),score=82.62 GHVN01095019.1:157-1113(+)
MPVDDVRERFKTILPKVDIDADGKISQEEGVKWLVKIRDHITAHSVKLDMQTLDKDGDQMVTFEEIKLAMEDSDDSVVSELRTRYDIVDKDKNGKLNLDELSRLVTGNDEEIQRLELNDILMTHDLDKDGKITRFEFLQFDEELYANLDEGQKEMLANEFDSADTNKDDTLDETELKRLFDIHSDEDFTKSISKLWSELAKGNESIPIEDMVGKDFDKWVSSVLTDDGELLRFPDSYDLDLPFKNIEKPPADDDDEDDDEVEELDGKDVPKEFDFEGVGDDEEAPSSEEESPQGKAEEETAETPAVEAEMSGETRDEL